MLDRVGPGRTASMLSILALSLNILIAAAEERPEAGLAREQDRVDPQLVLPSLDEKRFHCNAAASGDEKTLDKDRIAACARYGHMLLDHADTLPSEGELPAEVAQARDLFREVLSMEPDNVSALWGLGRTFGYGKGDRTEGIVALMRARSLAPSRLEFMEDLVELLATSGRIEEAGDMLDEIRARTTAFSPSHKAEWGLYFGVGRYAAALRASGDEAGALAALRLAFDRMQYPELVANMTKRFESYSALTAERPNLARYQEANEALRRKDNDMALELFESIVAESTDPALRNAARAAANDIRPAVVHDRVITRHRAAMDLTKAGDTVGAIRALEALVAEYGDMAKQDLARITADLRRLRRRPAAGSKPPLTMTLERKGNKLVRAVDGMEMTQIPAGSFLMGSEVHIDDGEPIHRVSFTRDFLMDRHEVTVEQYRRVMWTTPEGQIGKSNTPVVNVKWKDADEYCAKVGGRLPTEAEWEYAARGGFEGKRFSWGDEAVCMGGKCQANLCDRSCLRQYHRNDAGSDDGYRKTSPVCSYEENRYELCDMIGNVREWVADWYGAYSAGDATDPAGPPSGTDRILRGGSWSRDAATSNVAYRFPIFPDETYADIGFRCARDAEPR